MDPISASEYFQQCQAVARECVAEAKERDLDVNDLLHETIDGHRWIIYTYYNLQVLQHSKHDNAYFEEFGPLTADGFSDAVQKMAFAAMLADVHEELSNLDDAASDEDL